MDVQVEYAKAKIKQNGVIWFIDGVRCHQSVGRPRRLFELVSSKHSKLMHPQACEMCVINAGGVG